MLETYEVQVHRVVFNFPFIHLTFCSPDTLAANTQTGFMPILEWMARGISGTHMTRQRRFGMHKTRFVQRL